ASCALAISSTAQSRRHQPQDLRTNLSYITGADCRNQITWLEELHDLLSQIASGAWNVADVRVPDGADQMLGSNAFDRLAARNIHVGDDDQVRMVEAPAELFPEILEPSWLVWLENSYHSRGWRLRAGTLTLLADVVHRSLESGCYFGWMVRVIIDDGNIFLLADNLKTACHTGKG